MNLDKSKIEELYKLKLRVKLRNSYYEFFKYFWETVSTEDLIENWHIKYLCDELQKVGVQVIERRKKEYDLIINISPGESKSTIATVLFPVWLWVNDPSIRVISGSYSKDLSTDHAVNSRDSIKSEKFQYLYGDAFELRKDIDGKTNFQNDKGGFRKSVSVGSSVTGKHAHLLIVDDPINPKEAASEVMLKSSNDWMNKTLSSRKIDKANTPTILIMQRLHEDDPTGNWLEKAKRGKKIKHICLPATDDYPISPEELKERYTDGVMNPIRTGKEVLKEQKIELGSHEFAAQYGQSAQPMEGNMLKRWHFNLLPFVTASMFYQAPKIFFADLAFTAKEKNDPSGIMACKAYQGKLYVLDYTEFWEEIDERQESIVSFMEKHNARNAPIWIENKASGLDTTSSLVKNYGINAISFPAPPKDKVTKIKTKLPFLEAGRLVLLTKVNGQTWDYKKFIDNCLLFPYAKHDERIDCIFMGIDTFENYPAMFDINYRTKRRFRAIG